MRRASFIALTAGLMLLSGCNFINKHWVGWPFKTRGFSDSPPREPRPTSEPVYTPDSDSAPEAGARDRS